MGPLDVVTAGLLSATTASVCGGALVRGRTPVATTTWRQKWLGTGVCGLLAIVVPWWVAGRLALGLVGAALVAGVALASRRLTPLGRWVFAGSAVTQLLVAAFWLVCAWSGDAGPVADPVTWGIAVVSAVACLLALPNTVIEDYLAREVQLRATWSRPRRLTPADRRFDGPLISVQVPTYAEPPELVRATLDALAAQEYRAFEVVVIDNNTADELLWRPVQEHCRSLGPRFRFLHVDGVTGAKAGALNLVLRHTAPEAELIAVVDADYQAQPDFLSSLAGQFDDPRTGYVQTRHDYRDYRDRWDGAYLRGCYWEYRQPYAAYLVSRNEYNTALTTGTMCVVRRSTLEAVGGWAEWCATEDSELAVRMLAAGYGGRYVNQTLGRGLIPATFAGHRSQRHRWIRGPVQELRHHWRRYLPRRWATPSSLTTGQKLLLAHHGLRPAVQSVANSAVWLLALALVVAPWFPSHSAVPATAAVALLTAKAASGWTLLRAQRFASDCTARDLAAATLARLSLQRVTWAAGLSGLLGRGHAWGRTAKFAVRPTGWRSALEARAELYEGVVLALVCVVGLCAWRGNAVIGLALVTVLQRATTWLAAPLQALLADRALRVQREGDGTSTLVPDNEPVATAR
ncbi:glycosyltransferase [Streptacidiphilus fuscans]|nr:glycosyltransferase [Streptacidiphilus fuscans]